MKIIAPLFRLRAFNVASQALIRYSSIDCKSVEPRAIAA